jgi:transcriptional regulator with XRE-family HTH domain
MNDNALGQFVRREMAGRGLNQIEFAALLGVSHTTVGRVLRGKIKDPSLDFIVKLANATHFDICSIVYLIRPDAFKGPPAIDIISQQIGRLSETERKLFETLIAGLAANQRKERGDGE